MIEPNGVCQWCDVPHGGHQAECPAADRDRWKAWAYQWESRQVSTRQQLDDAITARESWRDLHYQAADRANRAELEAERLKDALTKIRAINWNLGGPANRTDAGDWILMAHEERKLMAIINDALGIPRQPE